MTCIFNINSFEILLVIVQSHLKGKGANFVRDWKQYRNGFGSIAEKNYWIGLEKLHDLTDSGSYGLQIVLKLNGGETKVIEYDTFRVNGENDKYRLWVSGFRPGNSGLQDRLKRHSGKPFTTYDRDNDLADKINCAQHYGSAGWWFDACYDSHLNNPQGPTWIVWNQYEEESTMILIKSKYI